MKKVCLRFNVVTAVASLMALVPAQALAQTPQPQKSQNGVVIKGKAPVNKDVLKVKLPRPYETTLDNGMRVVVLENHKLPTFSMQMVVLNGGLSDPEGRPGTALYTVTMLLEGTKTRTSKQISEQTESLGATFLTGGGLSTAISVTVCSGLTDNFDQVMDLFADVVLNPSFPADEFDKLKTRTISQLRSQRGQSDFLASELLSKVIYGKHPAARTSLTAEELQRITPDVLQKFHAAYYKPNNAIFAIVGDVKPAEVVARLNKAFGSWQRGDVPQTSTPKVSETGPSKIHLINRASSVQTYLLLGTLSVERTDPDYYALEVMNQVLGGGPSARLFLNLREDKGYAYGTFSGVSSYKYRGTFRAFAEVGTDVTKGSMDELMYEIKRLRDERVPDDEFDRTKRTIIGRFALQLESPQTLLQNIITQKLYNLPADYWDAYTNKIAAVTKEDVQRVAQKYLDLSRLQVIAVGDAGKIADVLRQYGPVEIYDTEGKPVKSSGGN